MQLILTPPPKVMVILKEISFNYGSPDLNTCIFVRSRATVLHLFRDLTKVCTQVLDIGS